MSVVLLGMEMPHDCPHCEFAAIGYASPMSSDCTLYCRAVDKFKDCATAVLKDKPYEVINHYNDRPNWCPLRPLPEKHGRLIDESILRETFGIGEKCEECKQDTRECRFIRSFTRMDFCGWIDDMETIVEAEGE